MPAKLSRRTVLKGAGLSMVSASLAQYPFCSAIADDRAASDQAAMVPEVLTAKTGQAPISNGRMPDTRIWGYNGLVPGPLLRVRQGDRLSVKVKNELAQPTSVHWHGIRIANNMDGSPLVQTPIESGSSFDYDFVVPDAGTYWYHTHTRGFEQLTRGLYGPLIVEENKPLAESYDDDQLLIFDDWMLDDEGQIREDNLGSMMFMSHGGRIGNWGSVNGVNKPDIEFTAGSRVRVRCINVCNARVLNLNFGSLNPWIVAHDGQPIEPELVNEIMLLAPGQRSDLVIDFPLESAQSYQIGVEVRGEVYEAANWVIDDRKALRSRNTNPAALPDNSLADVNLADESVVEFQLNMEGGAMGQMREALYGGELKDIKALLNLGRVWAFNGRSDSDKSKSPLFDVPSGTTVAIQITNNTSWPHAMHLHGHHFRVVASEGRPIAPGPWRDTHLMQPGEEHTIALIADNPGDWLMHCHMVEHAASGMTGWFRVS